MLVECACSPQRCEIHVKQSIQINIETKRGAYKQVDIENGTKIETWKLSTDKMHQSNWDI